MKNCIVILLLSVIVLPVFAQPKRKRHSYATQTGTTSIPAGTLIRARIVESLNSGTVQEGQVFHATLEDPIVVNGQTLFPHNSDVTGSVLAVHQSGRLSDPGVLKLGLTSVTNGARTMPLSVDPFEIKGESHTTSNVEKIGGGTAVGAIIGGIAGGGKGAAIGAGAGAAAGTGVAAATGKHEAKVESETVLYWTTTASNTTSATTNGTPAQSSPASYPTSANSTPAQAPALDPNASHSFSAHDRRVIRECLEDSRSDLPPGLAKRDSLPPGLERQLERNGTLPPGLEKRVHSLPEECERQLPPLPNDLERVFCSNHVMIIDASRRILDAFLLDDEQ